MSDEAPTPDNHAQSNHLDRVSAQDPPAPDDRTKAGAAGTGALSLGSMTGNTALPTGSLSWAGANTKTASLDATWLPEHADRLLGLQRTGRPTSPGAEGLLGVVRRVLDHGEVELVDYCGTDEQLVKVARVSTGSERQDLGLLAYLVRHRHTSPIEFARLTIRVKLPIFLARQWIRHRTGSFSERSLRYQPPLCDAYVPAPDYVQGKPTQNKQGRGADLPPERAARVREEIGDHNAAALGVYGLLSGERFPDGALSDHLSGFEGVAAELARSVLPLGTYTEWYWTTDAHNLMHWLRLRLDAHAQKEIRAYGEVVMRIFEAWLPHLASAFRTHVLGAVTLSAREVVALTLLLREYGDLQSASLALAAGHDPAQRLGLSAGELREFAAKVAALAAPLGRAP